MVATINTLIQKYQVYLLKRAKHFVQSKQEAEDLFQDTIVRIIEQQDKYDSKRSFKAWSTQLMKNLYINQYNRRKRYRVIPSILEDTPTLLINSYNEAEENLAVEYLQLAIAKLAKPHRKAFQLFYEGYQQKEIAKKFKLPLGTVKYHIYMAKKELQRKGLNEKGEI